MAALFFTNHSMGNLGGYFNQWRQLAAEKQRNGRNKQIAPSGPSQNAIDSDSGPEIEEGHFLDQMLQQSVQQDDSLAEELSAESLDSDQIADKGAKKMIDQLRKLGPHSKQILNYSYPPLLYQRGEEDEEGEVSVEHEGECDEDEEDEEYNSHMMDDLDDMGQLPQLHDSDDEELMALEGQLGNHHAVLDGDDCDEEELIDEDDQILNRLRSIDRNEVLGGSDFHLRGGNATNLDDLDKDEVLKMINQQVEGDYDSEEDHPFFD